jgi:hypothetical protein
MSEGPGPYWVKSSLSFSNGGCVEVAGLPGGGAGVRNSRDPGGPVLEFTAAEWDAFLGGVRLGEFDRFGGAVRLGRGAAEQSPRRGDGGCARPPKRTGGRKASLTRRSVRVAGCGVTGG